MANTSSNLLADLQLLRGKLHNRLARRFVWDASYWATTFSSLANRRSDKPRIRRATFTYYSSLHYTSVCWTFITSFKYLVMCILLQRGVRCRQALLYCSLLRHFCVQSSRILWSLLSAAGLWEVSLQVLHLTGLLHELKDLSLEWGDAVEGCAWRIKVPPAHSII